MLKHIVNPSFFEGCEEGVTLPLSFSKGMIKVWECFEKSLSASPSHCQCLYPTLPFLSCQDSCGEALKFCVYDIDISALSCDHPMAAQGVEVWGRLWQREQGSKGLSACQPCSKHSTAPGESSSTVTYCWWSLLKSKESLITISETLWELYKQWGQSTSWDL